MAGKENREIKNSVFVDLFYEDESAEANEIALFNAIHDEPLPEGTKIRKFRVDNTIYRELLTLHPLAFLLHRTRDQLIYLS